MTNVVEYCYPYLEKGVGIFIMIIVCDRLKKTVFPWLHVCFLSLLI